MTNKRNTFMASLAAVFALVAPADAKPLKVYILAGQSNMEGQANVETFDHIGDDPATAPLLKEMRNDDGTPHISERVRISYFTGIGENNGEGMGKLTTGFGARGNPAEDGGKIGPEFTFGITMEKAYDGPILIIKTAWGGKSLHTDFRPPSAGPYELSTFQKEMYPKQEGHGIPPDFEQWKIDKVKETGSYYRLMVEHVSKVLGDIKRVVPEYDPAQGYELAGFVWFQGWNDMVDGHVYPGHNQPDRYDLYSELMADFIRDVRKEFSAPKMPFVIGVMGVGGTEDVPADQEGFRRAMAAPADLPEFKGNVVAVETAPFWSKDLGAIDAKFGQVRQMEWFLKSEHKEHANKDGKMTAEQQQAWIKDYRAKIITPEDEALWKRGASNAGYHYLGSSKTMALIGRAFADGLLGMEKK